MALQHKHTCKMIKSIMDAPCITNAQITQTLKFRYERYFKNYRKKHILKQDISPTRNMCMSQHNDTCLHLLSCCIDKHIINLTTNWHNKAIHTPANTLLAHSTTRCFSLINAGTIKDRTPYNTICLWLLPCTCYLPRYNCPTRLRPDILCILGAPPINKPPFTQPKPQNTNSLFHLL